MEVMPSIDLNIVFSATATAQEKETLQQLQFHSLKSMCVLFSFEVLWWSCLVILMLEEKIDTL